MMDIVLIPGALNTSKLWTQQMSLFQQKKVHFVDVLNSDSIVEMASRYAQIAPKKFTLVGFSMGGYVALELYRQLPENIEKLILINSAANVMSKKGVLERERSLDLINKGKFEFLIKLIFKNSICDKEKQDFLMPIFQSMAYEVGTENYKKQLIAMLNKPDHSLLLASISCPTLLIAGEQDVVMPKAQSEHLASHIKNAELITIESCGHMAMLEQPEKMNQILNAWL
ncbi:alpha/beta fold hydrolase [Legionella santicrucis]|uniref:alpha/beta fold hydrolase n=1 Tax=Legionella santicrucis TaxID=45074 RepID=UPI000731474E|nr:alpha/beta hydrolase [Legionella santicrucis]